MSVSTARRGRPDRRDVTDQHAGHRPGRSIGRTGGGCADAEDRDVPRPIRRAGGDRRSVSTADDAAKFAAGWRQIVTAIRAVNGQHFTFDWAPTLNSGGIDPALAYPGDNYVTDIGVSVYDWSSTPYLASSDRWKELVNNRYGLAWQARFAPQHRKPISFPEWGLAINVNAPGYGGGETPTFIQNMYSWFGSHNTAFENYFDSDTDYGVYYGVHTGSGRFPVASATYQQLYSGSSAQPTGRGSLRSRASFARTSGSPLP